MVKSVGTTGTMSMTLHILKVLEILGGRWRTYKRWELWGACENNFDGFFRF